MESLAEERSQLVPIRSYGGRRAIVFVHGLMGHPRNSWERFPEFIERDENLSAWDIFSFGYASSAFSLTRTAPSYEALALLLYTKLCKTRFAEYERFAIVAHGEGGLIVQLALLAHEDFAKHVSHVFFFATPNAGLRLLSFDQFQHLFRLFGMFVFVPGLGSLVNRLLEFVLKPLFELRPGSPFLKDLGEKWQHKFGDGAPFRYWAIAGDRDSLVSVDSLLTFSAEHRLVAPGDHLSIIHPDSSTAVSVESFAMACVSKCCLRIRVGPPKARSPWPPSRKLMSLTFLSTTPALMEAKFGRSPNN